MLKRGTFPFARGIENRELQDGDVVNVGRVMETEAAKKDGELTGSRLENAREVG